MRILYAVFHPIPVSETYIRNEIEWMERQDVVIGVWARFPTTRVTHPDPGRPYWVSDPNDVGIAIDEFKPDIVHSHPLFIGQMIADYVGMKGIPLTARGHVGFTNREPENVFEIRNFLTKKVVSRVWAFPHISRDINHHKVVPLPATYAPEYYVPGTPDKKRFVLRIGTALPAKGWEEFIEIARRCPKISFTAALSVSNPKYADELIASGPKNITFHTDLQRPECVKLMQESWVYLRGHDPGPCPACHRYGMPISIAEALGCGLPIIAREAPEARDYIGAQGIFYKDITQATLEVAKAMEWPESKRKAISDRAIEQAKLYRSDVNFPQVLSYWKQLVR